MKLTSYLTVGFGTTPNTLNTVGDELQWGEIYHGPQ